VRTQTQPPSTRGKLRAFILADAKVLCQPHRAALSIKFIYMPNPSILARIQGPTPPVALVPDDAITPCLTTIGVSLSPLEAIVLPIEEHENEHVHDKMTIPIPSATNASPERSGAIDSSPNAPTVVKPAYSALRRARSRG
jgi:hypothetical protein